MRSASRFLTGKLSRRDFSRGLIAVPASAALASVPLRPAGGCPVALLQGGDRTANVRKSIRLLGGLELEGKDIWVKASFDSPNPYPATTHPDMLKAVVGALRASGCGAVRLLEQSRMGMTKDVLSSLGILDKARELRLEVVMLDDLSAADWQESVVADSHWTRGLELPRFLSDGSPLVQVCNLSVHRFGARFSASMESAMGLFARTSHSEPLHNFVAELAESDRAMWLIAEANTLVRPALSFMDAVHVFVDEGPEKGEIASPGLFAASRDRVALDAVGLAVLRIHSTSLDESKAVFEDEQIKRAAELKLGCAGAEEVSFVTDDSAGAALGSQILAVLRDVPQDKNKAQKLGA